MKLQIFSVLDTAAQIFSQPFYMHNEATALRVVKNCVNNPEHNYSLNPEDYNLYHMGEFDDTTGTITNNPVKVTRLDALVQKKFSIATDIQKHEDDK